MNRLLIIGHQYPEPGSSAAGTRMMQIIQLFQLSQFEIHFASEAQKGEFAVNLEKMGIGTSKIKLNDSSFDSWIHDLDPQVVLFDRFMIEEQFGWRVEKVCTSAIRVLDTEDLHFLRKARGIAVKENRSVTENDIKSDEARREVASIFRSDLSLMISQFEIELLETSFHVPKSHLFYLPFLWNQSDLSLPIPFSERAHFVSIGNFLHEPNWDATKRLKEVIWPEIRKELPNAEMHIYGAYASDKVSQMHDESSGFLIKGRAENAMKVISNARVMLAPLRFGAGLKGKLFEALICSTPSVTTSIGAEGMSQNRKWNGAVENDELEFAKSAVELYQNESKWNSANVDGGVLLQQFVKSNFEADFKLKLAYLEENLEQHRLGNFTGSMLLYHTQRSTEFMSRWIEEKNRSANS